MRARLLKPGFFQNEDLADLPPLARLLFAGLWCLADREGRLEDRPRRIKAEIFPYEDVDLESLLVALADAGFIIRYTASGQRCIVICHFTRHQHVNQHEPDSVLPAPEPDMPMHMQARASTNAARAFSPVIKAEIKQKEIVVDVGGGCKGGVAPSRSADAEPPAPPAATSFPASEVCDDESTTETRSLGSEQSDSPHAISNGQASQVPRRLAAKSLRPDVQQVLDTLGIEHTASAVTAATGVIDKYPQLDHALLAAVCAQWWTTRKRRKPTIAAYRNWCKKEIESHNGHDEATRSGAGGMGTPTRSQTGSDRSISDYSHIDPNDPYRNLPPHLRAARERMDRLMGRLPSTPDSAGADVPGVRLPAAGG